MPRPPYRTSKLQEKPSALKREHQNIKFLIFFLFLWHNFALLGPNPIRIRIRNTVEQQRQLRQQNSLLLDSLCFSLTGGSEYPVQDGVEALAALLQGVGVVPLAQRFPLHRVEWKTLSKYDIQTIQICGCSPKYCAIQYSGSRPVSRIMYFYVSGSGT